MKIKQSKYISLKQLDDTFSTLSVPLKLFNSLLDAVTNNDYSQLSDAVVKARFLDSKDKVGNHIQNTVYQNVYKGETYESVIEILINIYSIIDSLVETRLNITDISRQNFQSVTDFLDSFGFSIYPILGESISKDISRQIYYYIRRKGTPNIIAVFLNKLGFSHYVINEYDLTRKDCKWVFAPETVYATESMRNRKYPFKDIPLTEIDDPLWWMDEKDLNKLFYDANDTCPNMIRDGTETDIINPLLHSRSKITSLMLKNFGEFDYFGEGNLIDNDTSLNAIYDSQVLKNDVTNQRPDIVHTLNRIKLNYPNVDTIWINIPWFYTGDTVTMNDEQWFIIDTEEKATITPYISSNLKHNISKSISDYWKVSDGEPPENEMDVVDVDWSYINFTVDNTPEHVDATQPSTPTDLSIVWLVQALKDQGYKVGIYPTLQHYKGIGDCDKILCTDKNWFDLFSYNYITMYMHYQKLLTSNGIIPDYFSIGSNMKSLTSAYTTYVYSDTVNTYAQLVNTVVSTPSAGNVCQYKKFEFIEILKYVARLIKGYSAITKVGYSANYDEYAYEPNGIYNMDFLYTDQNIDFIGIRAYFPQSLKGTNNYKELLDGLSKDLYYDTKFKTYPTDRRTLKTSKRTGIGFTDLTFDELDIQKSLKNVHRWFNGNHWSEEQVGYVTAMSNQKMWILKTYGTNLFGNSVSMIKTSGSFYDVLDIKDTWFNMNANNYIIGFYPKYEYPISFDIPDFEPQISYQVSIKFALTSLPETECPIIRLCSEFSHSPSDDRIRIAINETGQITFVIKTSINQYQYVWDTNIQVDADYDVKIICEQSFISIMINDIIVHTYTLPSGYNVYPDNTKVYINKDPNYTNIYLTGKLYEVTFFDLTNSEEPVSYDYRFEDNVRGFKSQWTSKLKPVYFTELGIASINSSSIEPNIEPVFTIKDPIVPRNSSGISDDDHQVIALNAALDHWNSLNIIDQITINYFDARPWEAIIMTSSDGTYYYPDAYNYQYSHTLNGKRIDIDTELV